MTSFEEQFPSLKDFNNKYTNLAIFITKEDIQRYCLDKQKVKEILYKYRMDEYLRETICKELGL